MPNKRYNSKAWLAWMGFFIGCGGSVLYWALSTGPHQMRYEKTAIMVASITLVASGICFIASTADWWLKR